MKKAILKYFLEFFVIVIGISMSFYVEKFNENSNNENLKNQSLKRILKNLEVDQKDYEYNLTATKKAIGSTNWILKNQHNLFQFSRDTVGVHLNYATTIITIFVDNQEEYRSLQNSGLIELIENEEIVIRLQEKYLDHEFMKEVERFIIEKIIKLEPFVFSNIEFQSERRDEIGHPNNRVYVGNNKINREIIQMMFDKKMW
ncbi:MAG: hypothetical protein VW080_05065 [Flavobacteriaceae bacterium]